MEASPTNQSAPRRPLRLWPGVLLVALQWLLGFVVPTFFSAAGAFGAMFALFAGLLIVVWWAFFSRAPGFERWIAVALMIAALAATQPILHESIREAGMGVLFFLYAIPLLCLAFLVWAIAGRRLSVGPRRATMIATILLACGGWTLVQTTGVTGTGDWDFEWRWAQTHEDRLLAQTGEEPGLAAPASASLDGATSEIEPEWPGFRGPRRDGVIRGSRIDTDWTLSPPAELWRRPVGPGWSSFAVRGNRLYTQEQLGEDELVVCYDTTTGAPIWRHHDAARFWEPQAGAGPRATPTLDGDRVYTFGATGILNALDADDGTVIWSRNAASDTSAEIPGWGFSSSPLVVGDVVIVDTGTLIAYDLTTGEPRWVGPKSNVSYSSPQLLTLDGVLQVVLLAGSGAVSVTPTDGQVLWEHPWPGSAIVQPALTANGDLLLSAVGMNGGRAMRRLAVTRGADGWGTAERWTSNGLKPNFSDFVAHNGHAFGFDGRILASINLEDGERNWKGGRYGSGQLVLLADQDLLLVVSEKGELALVAATPDRFEEVARFAAIEGKTWNHPVLVDDLLLLRNGVEMAAFRLALASG